MAYRKFKGYRKKSRTVTCSYEEIIDFNTDGGSISVMGIHTPDDDTPRKMFPGLFQQFKHYKYLGCKVIGANAAQLPVDPMSVGYEAGEEVGATIDPRDVFDPILFHGCHGEDLGAVLNRLYTSGTVDEITASINGFTESDDALDMGRPEILEGLYYKALTDRTWRKMPIQNGINLKGLHPLVYNMATNHYISPNEQGAEFYDAINGDIEGFKVPDVISNATGVSTFRDTRFFTPSLRRLGWMDTRLPYMAQGNDIPSGDPDGETAYADWLAKLKSTVNYAKMPRIFMGVLLIPKSRRVKQYMRMRIVHYFRFAGFRGASMDVNMLGAPAFYEVGNDYGNAESNDDTILGGNPNEDGSDDGGDTPTPEPQPTSFTLKYEIGALPSNPLTMWLATSNAFDGTNVVAGTSKSLTANTTETMTVDNGEYYLFVGEGTSAVSYTKLHLTINQNATTGTQITNGNLNAYVVSPTVNSNGTDVTVAINWS